MILAIGSMLSITAGNARVRVSWSDAALRRTIEGTPEAVRRAIPNAGSMVRYISITKECGEPVIVYNLGTLDEMK
jgi:hypothetical protein